METDKNSSRLRPFRWVPEEAIRVLFAQSDTSQDSKEEPPKPTVIVGTEQLDEIEAGLVQELGIKNPAAAKEACAAIALSQNELKARAQELSSAINDPVATA